MLDVMIRGGGLVGGTGGYTDPCVQPIGIEWVMVAGNKAVEDGH